MMTTDKLLTIDDVSRLLSTTPRVVRRLIRDQRVQHIELPGGRFRVEAAALAEFIEGCKSGRART